MSTQIVLGIKDLFLQLLGVLTCQSFTRIVPFEDDYIAQGHGFFLGEACIQWLIYEELGRPGPLASAACLTSDHSERSPVLELSMGLMEAFVGLSPQFNFSPFPCPTALLRFPLFL